MASWRMSRTRLCQLAKNDLSVFGDSSDQLTDHTSLTTAIANNSHFPVEIDVGRFCNLACLNRLWYANPKTQSQFLCVSQGSNFCESYRNYAGYSE